MSLPFYPAQGAILICDFRGFVDPEMVKRRPVVVVSPKRKNGPRLCTVLPLSTTPPRPVENFHFKIQLDPPLPEPYEEEECWVKCDMIYQVSFDRLKLPTTGVKDESGKRIYDQRIVSAEDLKRMQDGIALALGLVV